MKKIFTITVSILFLGYGFQSNAQKLKGNGNVVEKQYKVASFQQLNLDGVFNTWISQGEAGC